jgi:hypothetical protein
VASSSLGYELVELTDVCPGALIPDHGAPRMDIITRCVGQEQAVTRCGPLRRHPVAGKRDPDTRPEFAGDIAGAVHLQPPCRAADNARRTLPRQRPEVTREADWSTGAACRRSLAGGHRMTCCRASACATRERYFALLRFHGYSDPSVSSKKTSARPKAHSPITPQMMRSPAFPAGSLV